MQKNQMVVPLLAAPPAAAMAVVEEWSRLEECQQASCQAAHEECQLASYAAPWQMAMGLSKAAWVAQHLHVSPRSPVSMER